MFGRLRQIWLSHPGVDRVIVGIVALYAIVASLTGLPSLTRAMEPRARVPLYAAAATVISLTGTLASLSVGQYISGKGDRVQALKESYGEQIAEAWKQTFMRSGAAAALAMLAIATDSSSAGARYSGSFFEVGLTVAALTFVRLVVLFGDIIYLVVNDDTTPLEMEDADIDMSAFEPDSGAPPSHAPDEQT